MKPSHWTADELTIDGVTLHFYRTGDSAKPPLVLQHGFSDNGLCWLQSALDLEDQYDIVMPDARGHGRSERVRPGEPVDMTADLARLIRALDLQRPIIAGHSMGASIAFEMGVRFPEIPRALILEDPPWFVPGQNMPADQTLAPIVENIKRSTLDELIAQARTEFPNWPEWVINTWCPAKKELDPQVLSVLNIEGTPWHEHVHHLICPTLIFTGDPAQGAIVTPAIAARVREMNHRCTVVRVPDAGHHIRFEDYETYMDHVRNFLQEIN